MNWTLRFYIRLKCVLVVYVKFVTSINNFVKVVNLYKSQLGSSEFWIDKWSSCPVVLVEPPPLPRSAPPPLPAPTQALETVSVKKKEPQFLINYTELEKVVTRLYPQGKQKYLSYSNVPWTLNLRKEVSIFTT